MAEEVIQGEGFIVKDKRTFDTEGKVKGESEKAEKEVQRLTGEHTALQNNFETVSNQVNELVKAQEEREREGVKDDPVALSSLEARQANTREKIRLEGVQKEADRKIREADEKEKEANAKNISASIKLAAVEHGVKESDLADLVPDGDPERLTKMAKILAQSGQKEPEKDKDGKTMTAIYMADLSID